MRLLAHLTIGVAACWAASAPAATLTTLYSFQGGADGADPQSELVADAAGNLYGTTPNGGGSAACETGCGTVFKLAPNGDGSYSESVLYAFQGGTDGAAPQAGLVQGPDGTLYGTTMLGGGTACFGGCGTVFAVDPVTTTETILHVFQGAMDGAGPACTLVVDPDASNLYGVTLAGGGSRVVTTGRFPVTAGYGTFFQLHNTGAGWVNTIHRRFFNGNAVQQPLTVARGPDGNFYGTSIQMSPLTGVLRTDGVFLLKPAAVEGRPWVYKTLFLFGDPLGNNFFGRPIFGSDGAVFGTAFADGGDVAGGAAYKLTQSRPKLGPDFWNASVLHAFFSHPLVPDAFGPMSGLVADSKGNFYGTTVAGGEHFPPPHKGTVYKLAPDGRKNYVEKILWQFVVFKQGTEGPRGFAPRGSLILDSAGNLYGTTSQGGAFGFGTVFRLTP